MASFLDLDEGHDDGDVVAAFPSMGEARRYLQRTAEWALALLDELEGDPEAESYLGDNKPDLEDESEHDEPSLGSLDRQPQDRSYRQGRDLFGQADLEGDERGRDPDLEPSLGWTTSGMLGAANDDREQDAGDEPEVENEHGSETGDTGDNGIADAGALHEFRSQQAEAFAVVAVPSICNVTMLGDLSEAAFIEAFPRLEAETMCGDQDEANRRPSHKGWPARHSAPSVAPHDAVCSSASIGQQSNLVLTTPSA